jgi:hypothetical protein
MNFKLAFAHGSCRYKISVPSPCTFLLAVGMHTSLNIFLLDPHLFHLIPISFSIRRKDITLQLKSVLFFNTDKLLTGRYYLLSEIQIYSNVITVEQSHVSLHSVHFDAFRGVDNVPSRTQLLLMRCIVLDDVLQYFAALSITFATRTLKYLSLCCELLVHASFVLTHSYLAMNRAPRTQENSLVTCINMQHMGDVKSFMFMRQ